MKMCASTVRTTSTCCTWLRNKELISYLLILLLQCSNHEAEAHILVYRHITNQLIEEYNDLPAQFGPSFPGNGLSTFAIAAFPLNACTKMDPPPPTFSRDHPTIMHYTAIIERGDCVFETKIRNAQIANFDAVIVFNNDGDDLEQMSAKNDSGIHIPSVFVGETAGANLRSLVAHGHTDVVLVINNELPFNINTQLILPFSILIGLCFLIMIFYMVYKCIREERRLRRYRLPKSMLKKLPILKYTKANTDLSCETCVICLEDFVEGDKLRVLPCNHPYHSHCIDPWLTEMRRVCPICKRKVFTKGEARANRNRQYSLDSITDTDDDTTPLLQTSTAAAAPGSNRHNRPDLRAAAARASGRLLRSQAHRSYSTNSSATPTTRASPPRRSDTDRSGVETPSDDENILLSHQSPAHRRVNPFDRTPNLPQQYTDQLNNQTRSIWSFFRLFRRAAPAISVVAPPFVEEVVSEIITSSQRRTTPASLMTSAGTPIINAAVAAASNNILNPNLSGSFKDDDELPPHQNIYEPIVVVTPTTTTAAHQSSQTLLTNELYIETPSPVGRIGVVALPNTNERRAHNVGSARNQFLI